MESARFWVEFTMKRIYEITYTHRDCTEIGGHKVSTMADGISEAIHRFNKKHPFKTILKIEAFPKSEYLE